MMDLSHYRVLAPLFVYPDETYPALVQAAIDELGGRYSESTEFLETFAALLPRVCPLTPEVAVHETQEIFTRSFEVQSITTLDVGYVIFGDDYKRAELLVNLNREHRLVENDCGSELSDHLPNVLRLLAVWENTELAEEFVQQILHPAIQRMIEEFHPERIEMRNALYMKHHKTLIVTSELRVKMFHLPLKALYAALREDYKFVYEQPPEESSEFLSSITREMEIAARGAGHRPSSARIP